MLIVHFDDYTKPLGDTLMMPRALDSMPRTLEWLAAVRDLYDPDVTIRRPVFGRAMVLYPDDTGT